MSMHMSKVVLHLIHRSYRLSYKYHDNLKTIIKQNSVRSEKIEYRTILEIKLIIETLHLLKNNEISHYINSIS